MLHSVLLPTDLRSDSANVIEFAKGLPHIGVRRVVLAHAIDASGMEGPVIVAAVDHARAALLELAPELEAAGLRVEVRVPAGDDPTHELIALAAESHVSGVVCGTEGRGRVSRLVAGSVSEALFRHSKVPAFLVRFDVLRDCEDATALSRRFCERLIMATDFSASASRALHVILELPEGSVQEVVLLHVIDPRLTGEKRRAEEEGAEYHLRGFAAMLEARGTRAITVICCGDPSDCVLSELAKHEGTGVVIGTRGRGALGGAILGSVAATITEHAPCPVLVVS